MHLARNQQIHWVCLTHPSFVHSPCALKPGQAKAALPVAIVQYFAGKEGLPGSTLHRDSNIGMLVRRKIRGSHCIGPAIAVHAEDYHRKFVGKHVAPGLGVAEGLGDDMRLREYSLRHLVEVPDVVNDVAVLYLEDMVSLIDAPAAGVERRSSTPC